MIVQDIPLTQIIVFVTLQLSRQVLRSKRIRQLQQIATLYNTCYIFVDTFVNIRPNSAKYEQKQPNTAQISEIDGPACYSQELPPASSAIHNRPGLFGFECADKSRGQIQNFPWSLLSRLLSGSLTMNDKALNTHVNSGYQIAPTQQIYIWIYAVKQLSS